MINETIQRPPAELVAGFRSLLAHDSITCALSDCMGRFNAMTSDMKPLFEGIRFVGTAVIDGACRDVEEIRKLRFPVFSKGIVPNVGAIAGYGQVNVPIQCAGVAVSPGDMVVADGNGVVVVPLAEAADILARARQLLETEHLVQEKLKAGATIGELVDIDSIFASTFSYQNKASKHD